MTVRRPKLKPRAPRNLAALAAMQRKAGPHQKSQAALRRKANQNLKSRLSEED